MIIFKLQDVLDQKGITEKDLIKMGMNRLTLKYLLAGQPKRIDCSVLNQLCKNLGCQPGDLHEYVPDNSDEE